MKFMCCLVVVEDLTKSRFLYETLLQQKVIADYGENIAFGAFALHQKNHFQRLIGSANIQSKSNNFELYFEEDDIEAVYDTIKQNGFDFVHELCEQPWKQRVFRFYDYDQNIVEIGETMEYVAYRLFSEHYSIQDICRFTYLDDKTVLEAINKYSS